MWVRALIIYLIGNYYLIYFAYCCSIPTTVHDKSRTFFAECSIYVTYMYDELIDDKN